jgi:hypothetical protein
MKTILIACILGLLISSAFADLYMHNPRGNNDRCDEQSNDRNNDQRLFDSQNNEAGGYCINTEPMYYYMGSLLSIEWTSQHSCGNDGKVNCNYVIQFACEDTLTTTANTDGPVRDGTPAANPENGNQNQCTGTITSTNPSNTDTGRNEPLTYFTNCNTRARNGGLLTLDQNLNGNTAQFTRQNPGGTQYGFECQEERDYYPYWQPTPWRDVAILTSRPNLCQDVYQSNSQNVVSKFYCSNPAFNSMAACTGGGGTWNEQQSFGMAAPDCIQAPWGRDNHLGSTNDGFMARYNWTLPYLNEAGGGYQTCILRMRYNISTGDYNDWSAFYANNAQLIAAGVTTNPPVSVTSTNNTKNSPIPFQVQLAVDTTQFGRTFQDRSYHWALVPRPSTIDKKETIWNLNVRGKRGNIAQVRNCMEYDFTPNMLQIGQGDYVHFQWTGCDRNDPNNTGEGTDRTDRSNVCQMKDWTVSFPLSLDQQNLFDSYATALQACLLGQTNCVPVDTLNNEQSTQNCGKLNAVMKPITPSTLDANGYPNNGDQSGTGAKTSFTAYFDLGALRWNNTGTYYYMGTRNNNFSNRGQKGVLTVQVELSAAAIAGIVVGSVAGVALIAAGGLFVAGRMMPDSWAASVLARFGLL